MVTNTALLIVKETKVLKVLVSLRSISIFAVFNKVNTC